MKKRMSVQKPSRAPALIIFVLATLGTLSAQPPKYIVFDLGTLGGNGTAANFFGLTDSAFAINNLGQVAGESATAAGDMHAFRSAAGMPVNPATDDLGTLGGVTQSRANGINDSGQVVGSVFDSSSTQTLAFRSTPNGQPIALTNLGTLVLGGSFAVANAINNAGEA